MQVSSLKNNKFVTGMGLIGIFITFPFSFFFLFAFVKAIFTETEWINNGSLLEIFYGAVIHPFFNIFILLVFVYALIGVAPGLLLGTLVGKYFKNQSAGMEIGMIAGMVVIATISLLLVEGETTQKLLNILGANSAGIIGAMMGRIIWRSLGSRIYVKFYT